MLVLEDQVKQGNQPSQNEMSADHQMEFDDADEKQQMMLFSQESENEFSAMSKMSEERRARTLRHR